MVRACRDPCSIVISVLKTEYLVMACNRWYEEARDGRSWIFSDALFGWVKLLKPEEVAGEDTEAFEFFYVMVTLRADLLVGAPDFRRALRPLNVTRRDRDGWVNFSTRRSASGVCLVT